MAKTNRKNAAASIAANISETTENVSENTVGNLSEQQQEVLNAGNTENPPVVENQEASNLEVPQAAESTLRPIVSAETNPVLAAMEEQKRLNAEEIARHGTATDHAVREGNRPPSPEQMLKDDIIGSYKPTDKLPEATAHAREDIAAIATTQNEIDGTLQARLTRHLADAGYALLQEGKISIGETIANDLIKKLSEAPGNNGKTLPYLGAVEVIKDDGKQSAMTTVLRKVDGEEKEVPTGAVVDVVSPYNKDRKTLANVKPAALRACLVLAGHQTRVRWGYIRKTECSGKRFTRQMVFLSREEINEAEIGEYYEAVCVPNNVISPNVYELEIVGENHVLVPKRASDNNTLRYLADDWAFALYHHHFSMGKVPLAYDLKMPKDKGTPTGLLLRVAPVEREPRPAGQEFTPKNWEEFKSGNEKDREAFFKAQQKAVAEAREAATGKVSAESFAVHANVMADIMKGCTERLPSHVLANVIRAARYALHNEIRMYYGQHVPPIDVARELIALTLETDGRIVWNDKTGQFFWHSEAGNNLGVLQNKLPSNTPQAA